MGQPLVAIVGAPNVGKSTLFNRLLGRRRSIVTDEPGMTRDRIDGQVGDADPPFRLVDTGGQTPGLDGPYAREIEHQAEIALAEAALVLLVVDARAGLTALDRELADRLRRRGRPLLVVANKCDSESAALGALEAHELGLGAPQAVSAEHGRGIADLLEQIERLLAGERHAEPAPEPEAPALSISIVGRPNVGKSSIFNRLAGEERAVVSDVPGTTRDAVDTLLRVGERVYRLVDTAGLRRRGKAERGPERFSAARARENLARADVAVLVLDAERGFAAQDAHVAGYAIEFFKPIIVAVNKWDLVPDREAAAKRWSDDVCRRLRFAKQAPVVFVSARTGQRVGKILELAETLHAAAGRRLPTPELNRWLGTLSGGDPDAPPPRGSLRLYYVTQTGTHPLTFTLFCNDPKRAHFSTRRRIENALRDRFALGAVPLRLRLRGRGEKAGGGRPARGKSRSTRVGRRP